MNWVLILSLVSLHSNGGSSLQTVEGFDSKEDCMAAGNAWLTQMREWRDTGWSPPAARAICVRR